MIVVFLGWILFRAEDFGLFCSYVKNLFVSHGGMILTSAYLDKKLLFLLIMGILFAGFVQKVYGLLREKMPGKFPENGVVTVPRIVASIAILWLCVLEQLYQKFNFARPTDYHGHSLSVSDVIMLNQNGKISAHYVDSIGFKELPGFLDKKPERPSVLMNLREKCDAPECNPTGCRKVRADHEL